MQSLLRKIAEILHLSEIGRRWKKVAGVLAVIVVFCTTYMLILPAITMEEDITCGYEEHVHSDKCYTLKESASGEESSDEYVLVCTLTEHTHSDACYITDNKTELDALINETQEIIRHVINEIDSLPTYDEIDAKLLEFAENGDEDGEIEYLTQLKKKAQNIYYTYSILGVYQDYITNADKLFELEWLWSAENLGLNSDGNFELDIYEVNNYYTGSVHPPIIIYGGSPSEVGISGFQWWAGIVVDSDTNGNFYVSQINSNMGSSYPKSDLKPSTSDGFVIFIWSGYGEYSSAVSNISVGDGVIVDFNYMTAAAYSGTALGTVTFGDVAEEEAELHIVESADTSELVKINLFNYGANINSLYSSNNSYPGFQQDYGTRTTLSSIGAYNMNFGNTVTADILAGISGLTTGATGLNRIEDINSSLTGEMNYLLGDDGYPVTANDLSLAYLFTDNTYATKQNTDNINGLFQQITETGEYYYDSHLNHAQFDADTDTFILYEEKISANFMMYPFGNFLPFTDIENDAKQSSKINGTYLTKIANRAYTRYTNGESKNSTSEYLGLYNALTSFVSIMNKNYTSGWSAKDCANLYFELNNVVDASGNYITFTDDDLDDIYTLDYDIPTDFYFGMEIDMNFIQPKGGLTGTTGKEPLNFYFTGDDDVWIYIDGVLFLDLTGIHRHVGGEIDFVNGVVNYYKLDTTIGDVSATPYATETFAEILERAGKSTDGLNETGTFDDYSTHTLKFFYMERGSGSGVCRMNFNLPLVKDNTITITKEHDIDTDVLGNPDYYFQVLKAVDGEKTEELFIGANTAYEVLDSAGNKIRDAVTDANGIIIIKAGETALITNSDDNIGEYYVRELIDDDFVSQYGQVIVNGTSTTTSIHGIHIGSDYFDSHESEIKDILNGHTNFDFINSIDTSELGALMLTKELIGTENTSSFTFNVTIDGEALPVGWNYILISDDGAETEMSVTQEGKISLKAGESVLIKDILSGSYFTVSEEADSKGDYTLSYKESGAYYTTDGDSASGYILPASTVSPIVMTAINIEDGAALNIDGVKTLENPDGSSHSYTVMLEEIVDSSGDTPKDGGTQLQTIVTLTENGSESFSFVLNFYDSQLNSGENKFYYRIYEYQTESLSDITDFDESVYVAEVTVDKTEDEITALITALFKNGEQVSIDELEFINTLTGQITVSKEVEGEMTDVHTTADFEFGLEFTYLDEPLDGTYIIEKTESSGVVTESEITLDNGKTAVSLKHNESFTVNGLPAGTVVKVTENTTGYYTTYTAGDSDVRTDGNTAELTVLTAKNSIKFFNHVAYVLPETGGIGTQVYIIGGLLISLSTVFLLCYISKRRERRVRGSRL